MSGDTLIILKNLVENLQPVWGFIQIVAYVMGFIIGVTAIVSLREGKGFGSLISFFAGAALVSLPSILDSISLTIFNTSSIQALSYSRIDDSPTQWYVTLGIYLIQLVGLMGVIKAGYLLAINRKLNDPTIGPKVLGHAIGGTCCINIVGLLHSLGATLGGSAASSINALIG